MGRLFIGALAIGLFPGALAATELNDRPSKGGERRTVEPAAQQSRTNASATVTDQCDIRRPSCRRWRALAHERLNGDRGEN